MAMQSYKESPAIPSERREEGRLLGREGRKELGSQNRRKQHPRILYGRAKSRKPSDNGRPRPKTLGFYAQRQVATKS